MATLNLKFEQAEVAEAQKGGSFDPIPAGNYIVEINRSEIKATKAGTGSYLSVGFKILDGNMAGRIIFQNITLANPNQIAANIGREQMAQLAGACGIYQLQDSEQLHGIPMEIKVTVKKDAQYGDSNDIKKFSPLQSAGFTAPSAQAPVSQGFTSPQAQAPTQPKAQPWVRGLNE